MNVIQAVLHFSQNLFVAYKKYLLDITVLLDSLKSDTIKCYVYFYM